MKERGWPEPEGQAEERPKHTSNKSILKCFSTFNP
jgi:hypothetical protein